MQKKNIMCKKLAACLFMTSTRSPIPEAKTGEHSEKEQSHEAVKKDEIKKDWMLAAAVFDRLCAIAFTAIFIGGNLIFVILFFAHP